MSLDAAIARLRERKETVPILPRLPTEAEVQEAERKLGVSFHPDYRDFLLKGSDIVFGMLEPAVVTPNAGHLDLVHVASRAWERMSFSPLRLSLILVDSRDMKLHRVLLGWIDSPDQALLVAAGILGKHAFGGLDNRPSRV